MRLGKLLSVGEIVDTAVAEQPQAPVPPQPAEPVEAPEVPVPAGSH